MTTTESKDMQDEDERDDDNEELITKAFTKDAIDRRASLETDAPSFYVFFNNAIKNKSNKTKIVFHNIQHYLAPVNKEQEQEDQESITMLHDNTNIEIKKYIILYK